MSWIQKQITLKPRNRGFHLIDDEIISQLPELHHYEVGLLHLFIQHTSASLTVNENADPTVRMDMESHFNHFVPQKQSYYRHDYEGDDDMPAHIKSSTLGCEMTLPIYQGCLRLGTWQGIYLGEHRDYGGARRIVATLQGQRS
ncbi:YjbQ family protein [Pseudoalteromonas sp. McH1-7]|uniref:secondary thiamine-phosphate synthase enzyme YjbQ n=1 Tax=unclassified Pseudoalteromonas TaxID=194690 RepID=UPI00159081FE|nr:MULTISPECIES: secondary thiamine-phosphate synthase enzyme YjbQ [unclassified Pseudoalteromonas]NUZ10471.1 YjbQ family protein [Pseudoalteromonas sp. McH1-7]USD28977.1 secondary thiamine-phosphate synthase enzyme YjbQ [Pseudoalteromonas sp. SCSIO 43201]